MADPPSHLASLARTVVRRRGQESGHSSPVSPLSRYGPAGSSTTAGNADRAVSSGRTQPTGKAKPALRVEPRPWEGCGVNGPAKFPLFDPGCLAVRARQARSRPHSKKGRSCSPWLDLDDFLPLLAHPGLCRNGTHGDLAHRAVVVEVDELGALAEAVGEGRTGRRGVPKVIAADFVSLGTHCLPRADTNQHGIGCGRGRHGGARGWWGMSWSFSFGFGVGQPALSLADQDGSGYDGETRRSTVAGAAATARPVAPAAATGHRKTGGAPPATAPVGGCRSLSG